MRDGEIKIRVEATKILEDIVKLSSLCALCVSWVWWQVSGGQVSRAGCIGGWLMEVEVEMDDCWAQAASIGRR